MRRKRSGCGWIALLLMVALSGAGFWAWWRVRPSGAGVTLRLTPDMLQAGLNKAFPVDKRALFLNVHLSEPVVALDPADNDRIGFGAQVDVSSGGRELVNGTVTASGKLRYDANSATFYLDAPEIKRLDIDRVSASIATPVRKAVSYVLDKAVRHLPVYQFDPGDPLQRLARRGIRAVRVNNGAVEVQLGMSGHDR